MDLDIQCYQEQKKSTAAVLNLYQMLMNLEKDNRKEEFEGVVFLLKKAIQMEKREYEKDQSLIKETAKVSIDKKFITLESSLEDLCNIRSLNLTSKDEVYFLQGNILKKSESRTKTSETSLVPIESLITFSPISSLVLPKSLEEANDIINEAFYKEICHVLINCNITEEEREILLNTKYALLITSKSLENKFINGDLRDMILPNVSDEDKDSLTLNLLPDMGKIVDRILDTIDTEFEQENVIAQLVYMNICLTLMNPIYSGVITNEFLHAVSLNEILGILKNEPRDKVNALIKKIFSKEFYTKNNHVEKK